MTTTLLLVTVLSAIASAAQLGHSLVQLTLTYLTVRHSTPPIAPTSPGTRSCDFRSEITNTAPTTKAAKTNQQTSALARATAMANRN